MKSKTKIHEQTYALHFYRTKTIRYHLSYIRETELVSQLHTKELKLKKLYAFIIFFHVLMMLECILLLKKKIVCQQRNLQFAPCPLYQTLEKNRTKRILIKQLNNNNRFLRLNMELNTKN